jgi:oxygen-independent coproporphyrinogen-3 oxidase
MLSVAGLDRLLNDIRSLLPVEADAEITLEANPGTVEAEKFAAFAASGVNRLSIGIQSFEDRFLQAIGRVHDGMQAQRAVDIAQKSFGNVNLDLMYALPGQSVDACAADLRRAIACGTQHLSVYQLTLEPNTVFAKYPPELPDEEHVVAMQSEVEALTNQAGFDHYEVSAYARHGKESRHNLNYWHFGDYLGIGAGAHGKLSFPERILRQTRSSNPDAYMQSCLAGRPVLEEKEVAARELGFEFMLNALRLRKGVAASLFFERTGLSLNEISEQISRAQTKGLLAESSELLKPTARGMRFLNDLQAIFL